jgi:Icc-related predicted phosphoesterase
MKVHIVSDVHGASDALARAADGSDLFICLGDLILFLDYDDPTRGIYADLFGTEHTRAYLEARTANRFDDARELSAAAWRGRGVFDQADRWASLEVMIRKQYEVLFEAMPTPALLTYGNVDVPALWPEFLKPEHQVVDGATVTINGIRMGFVGGGLASPMRTPYELTEEQYSQKIQALGPVDVLFTHIPPAVPQLTYDTVARRFETGSQATLDYLNEFAPAYHLFGHVHQPLRARARVGKTECLNVGHFHGRKLPFVIDL